MMCVFGDVSIGEITGPLVGAIASKGISRIDSQAFKEKLINFVKDERGSLNLNFDEWKFGGNARNVTAAAQSKGDKFFKSFLNRNPTNHSTQQIGKSTEFAVDVPGNNGKSFTRWVKVVGPDGRTIRLYHDTFDNTCKFLNRGIKVPGPERQFFIRAGRFRSHD